MRPGQRHIVEGERAALIYPGRVFPDLWVVSLGNDVADLILDTEAEAELAARRLLRSPNCRCWVTPPAASHPDTETR